MSENIYEEHKDKIYEHIKETMLHKSYVIHACLKMADHLQANGEKNLAISLLRRANVHDNSKLVGPELELLAGLYGNQEAFLDPTVELSSSQKEVIEKHWENNRHHPEHFEHLEDMTELDIIEMVCDWYARSLQYNTNFLEFITTRQETRFHFPKEMFEKVYSYCEILNKNNKE